MLLTLIPIAVFYILINIEFNLLPLISIVWPVMYRWDDPTETDNRGKSFALSPLSNILRVRFSLGN